MGGHKGSGLVTSDRLDSSHIPGVIRLAAAVLDRFFGGRDDSLSHALALKVMVFGNEFASVFESDIVMFWHVTPR